MSIWATHLSHRRVVGSSGPWNSTRFSRALLWRMRASSSCPALSQQWARFSRPLVAGRLSSPHLRWTISSCCLALTTRSSGPRLRLNRSARRTSHRLSQAGGCSKSHLRGSRCRTTARTGYCRRPNRSCLGQAPLHRRAARRSRPPDYLSDICRSRAARHDIVTTLEAITPHLVRSLDRKPLAPPRNGYGYTPEKWTPAASPWKPIHCLWQ